MFKHLLVPTDGSELSRHTATHAIAFARETGARITFFTALPDFPVSFHEGYGLADSAPGTPGGHRRNQGRAILDPLVARQPAAAVSPPGGRHHLATPPTRASSPPPPPRLRPDLHGLHGRRGIGALLLGSGPRRCSPIQDPGAGNR